ncbi:MAG: hypothetical protein KGI58_02515 [Patescibacteria group bacterium]|nr:hypothetical protein [Patescibacteria group bacterium]
MYSNNDQQKVEFEGDEFRMNHPTFQTQTQTPKIVRLVMKYSGGKIKDEKTAEYIVVGILILAIIIPLFFVFGNGHKVSLKQREKNIQINLQRLNNTSTPGK